jgi:hypothetical protein
LAETSFELISREERRFDDAAGGGKFREQLAEKGSVPPQPVVGGTNLLQTDRTVEPRVLKVLPARIDPEKRLAMPEWGFDLWRKSS